MSLYSEFIGYYRYITGLFIYWIYGTPVHRLLARLLYLPTILRLVIKQGGSYKNWYNRVDDTVILGALPFRSLTKKLVEVEGVRTVLSYNQNYELQLFTNSVEDWQKNGVQQYIYSTWDFHPPSLDQIQHGLSIIEKERALKQSVYVHCKAGKGRSATVVTCYLIKRYKLAPSDAIDFLERKRPQISMNEYQRKAITEFYETLNFQKKEKTK